jgi:DNA-binding NarL/FixJ family response regulator
MIRVGVYTNEPVLAVGLKEVVGSSSEMELIPPWDTTPALVAGMADEAPDVVLIDLTPQMTVSALREIQESSPECKIVLWVRSISVEMAHHAREIGVMGILRKDLSTNLTLRCLQKVAEGELWIERELMNSLLKAHPVRLSPRERQLLELLSRGHSNKQIGYALSISEGTVKVYFSRLFRKVGVADRFELALYGLRNLITSEGLEPCAEPLSVVVAKDGRGIARTH